MTLDISITQSFSLTEKFFLPDYLGIALQSCNRLLLRY